MTLSSDEPLFAGPFGFLSQAVEKTGRGVQACGSFIAGLFSHQQKDEVLLRKFYDRDFRNARIFNDWLRALKKSDEAIPVWVVSDKHEEEPMLMHIASDRIDKWIENLFNDPSPVLHPLSGKEVSRYPSQVFPVANQSLDSDEAKKAKLMYWRSKIIAEINSFDGLRMIAVPNILQFSEVEGAIIAEAFLSKLKNLVNGIERFPRLSQIVHDFPAFEDGESMLQVYLQELGRQSINIIKFATGYEGGEVAAKTLAARVVRIIQRQHPDFEGFDDPKWLEIVSGSSEISGSPEAER